MSSFVFDASAVLCLLNQETGFVTVQQALPGARISAVNWAEVLTKVNDQGGEPRANEAVLLGLELKIEPFDRHQALLVAQLRPLTRSVGLSLADRACLALSLQLSLIALTADRARARLPSMCGRVQLLR